MTPETCNSPETGNAGFSATNGSNVAYSEMTDAPESKDVFLVQRTVEVSQGPLPSPQILKEYDSIIENGAERIMAMAEKEQACRLEEKRQNGESNRMLAKRQLDYFKRGQWMGFTLALIVLVSAGVFTYFGYETLAGILLATTLVALVGLFVYSAKRQNKE